MSSNIVRLFVGLVFFAHVAVNAQEAVPPEYSRPATLDVQTASASRFGESRNLASIAALPPSETAAAAELKALRAHNAQPRPRMQNGFFRPILPHQVTLAGPSAGATAESASASHTAANGDLLWTGFVKVERAHSLRLALSDVKLPVGTRLWVYAPGGPAVAFGLEMLDPQGNLYCPVVGGDTVYLEIRVAAAALTDLNKLGFSVAGVIEGFALKSGRESDAGFVTSAEMAACVVETACIDDSYFSEISDYDPRQAIALLTFVDAGDSYLCSGGLLNDRPAGFPALLLTANHCFATQAAASSVVAYWDYSADYCGAPRDPYWMYPSTSGATLLSTSASNDFTLVRLAGTVPNTYGRVYLGWSPNRSSVSDGVRIFRISHPLGDVQSLSTSLISTSPNYGCGLSQDHFIFSDGEYGATDHGSSGSPGFTDGGYVVGQLYGKCYASGSEDPCQYSFYNTVDGAFFETYQAIKSWLDPAPTNLRASGSATAVTLSWTGVPNVTQYEVGRWSSNSGSYTAIGTTTSTSYTDLGVSQGNAYLYCVRTLVGAGRSGCSNLDLATTVSFTDEPLASGNVIKTAHLNELRAAVNAIRRFAGLSNAVLTDPAALSIIRAAHITELRTALDAAMSLIGLTTGGYSTGAAPGAAVRAIHFQEIRNRVR